MLWSCFLRKLLILQLALQILRLHDTRDKAPCHNENTCNMLGSRVRTLCGFQKIGSTFHGYAQSPLFKGVLDVSRVRGRFTLLSQCFHRG